MICRHLPESFAIDRDNANWNAGSIESGSVVKYQDGCRSLPLHAGCGDLSSGTGHYHRGEKPMLKSPDFGSDFLQGLVAAAAEIESMHSKVWTYARLIARTLRMKSKGWRCYQ